MMAFDPMPLVADFLLSYTIADAFLLLFILVAPVGIVKKSGKITGINFTMFGVLFLITPSMDADVPLFYTVLGVVLLVIGPMVYTVTKR